MSERLVWVAFMPDGFPCGVMNPRRSSGRDADKAFREFWDSAAEARKRKAEGYRIELMPMARWSNEFMPIHLNPKAWKAAS
ncbi:hypothetical protein PV703_15625 [Streptomyces sp. ME01-24h]|nr:hypothetical protein [Streptomyces sp. ME01-24h]